MFDVEVLIEQLDREFTSCCLNPTDNSTDPPAPFFTRTKTVSIRRDRSYLGAVKGGAVGSVAGSGRGHTAHQQHAQGGDNGRCGVGG